MANEEKKKNPVEAKSVKAPAKKASTTTTKKASTAKSGSAPAKKATATKKVTPVTKKASETKSVESKTVVKKQAKVKPEVVIPEVIKKEKKPEMLPRICAYFFDILIVAIVITLLSNVRFLNPKFDEYQKNYDKYQEHYKNYTEEKITLAEFNGNTVNITYNLYQYGATNYIIAFLVIVGYFVLFQKYNKGQTLGKKIMRLRVVSNDGKIPTLTMFLLRLVPLYIYSYSGIFSIISCFTLPFMMNYDMLSYWITAITIGNTILGLIDAGFFLIRKDKKSLHDLMTDTKVISEKAE